MPTEVIMPKVDMDMESGKIVAWYAEPGGAVEKGEPLFDIETEKATMEVEAPADGVLAHVLAEEGATVAIGRPVAWIYAADEEIGPPPGGAATGAGADDEAAAGMTDEAAAGMIDAAAGASADAPALAETGLANGEAAQPEAIRATPRARAMARETGLDLRALTGTDARGRIAAGDVAAALERAGPPAPRVAAGDAAPLNVISGGAGAETPLVFLHGFGDDAAGWAKLEASLGGGRRLTRPVHRIEAPCHGRSPRPPVEGFGDFAAHVIAAFDRIGGAPAHLVGHSLGGALALALADARPDAVSGLTLIAPAGLGPEMAAAPIRGIATAGRAESLGPWLKTLVADPGIMTPAYIRAAMTARADPEMRAAQAALAERIFADGTQCFDLRPALARLKAPARIIWGREDAILPWTQALSAPGAVALHLFARTGHLPHIERADEVAALILAALDQGRVDLSGLD